MIKKILFLALLGFQLNLLAATSQGSYHTYQSSGSARLRNRMGFDAGLMGGPFPQPFGVGLTYQAFDFLRLDVNYGAGYATDIGFGHSLSFGPTLMVPGWNITPTASLYWASVFGPANYDTGFGRDGRHLMAAVGADWQTEVGLSLGAGYNIPLQAEIGGVPYLRIGWHF